MLLKIVKNTQEVPVLLAFGRIIIERNGNILSNTMNLSTPDSIDQKILLTLYSTVSEKERFNIKIMIKIVDS